jgi:hypothetical protein
MVSPLLSLQDEQVQPCSEFCDLLIQFISISGVHIPGRVRFDCDRNQQL